MRTWLLMMSAASLALATPALAQDAEPAPETPEAPIEQEMTEPADSEAMDSEPVAAETDDGEAIKPAQEQNEMVGSWLIGTVIMSGTDESVGAINDILVDVETGEITGVVASVGGFLGIGAKAIAIDWDRLTIDFDGFEVTTDLTREEADAAPEYQFRDREVPPPPPSVGMSTDVTTGMEPAPLPADQNAETAPAE